MKNECTILVNFDLPIHLLQLVLFRLFGKQLQPPSVHWCLKILTTLNLSVQNEH